MPGKNPAEALYAYLQPLQQSLSCFGKSVLRSSLGAAPGVVQIATFSEPVVDLMTKAGELLALSFIQSFVLEQPESGLWKVRTISYLYGIENEAGHEIFGFHWHPEAATTRMISFPHLHIGHGAGAEIRDEVRAIHFRTDRMAFEDLGLLLLDEFHVEPERSDAGDVLMQTSKSLEKAEAGLDV